MFRFDPYDIFIGVLMVLTILPVHEWAHAYVADRLGDPTARFNGRLTLNPFAHLDLFGTLSLIFLGIGWGKAVPVNRYNFKHPKRDMMLTALAGPVSNIVLAFLLLVVYKLLWYFLLPVVGYSSMAMTMITILLNMAIISLYLAVFNLIPVPPLDGSRLLEYLIPARWYIKIQMYQMYIYIAMIVLLFSGILSRPIQWVAMLIFQLLDAITQFIPFLAGLIH